MAGTHRLRQNRIGDRLLAASPRRWLPRLFHLLSRIARRIVRVAGRPLRGESAAQVCEVRLPGHR